MEENCGYKLQKITTYDDWKDISNQDLMRDAKISANIITKIRNGQYMALDKVECTCLALDCTPNDILEFIPEEKIKNGK